MPPSARVFGRIPGAPDKRCNYMSIVSASRDELYQERHDSLQEALTALEVFIVG
jgi:hypothetical protein